jgi:ABC-type phosphate transport system substrate-binding protein
MCDKKIVVGIALLISVILLAAIIPQTISVIVYAQLPGTIAGQNQGQTNINGAGATFPFPLIDTWRVEYQKINQM